MAVLPPHTIRSHAKRGVSFYRFKAGLLTHRSTRCQQPSRPSRGQWQIMPARSLFTVARPCGIFTRFPFHSPVQDECLKRHHQYHDTRLRSNNCDRWQSRVHARRENLLLIQAEITRGLCDRNPAVEFALVKPVLKLTRNRPPMKHNNASLNHLAICG